MSEALAGIIAGSGMDRAPGGLGALGQRGNIWKSSQDDLQAMSRKFDGESGHLQGYNRSGEQALVSEATSAFHNVRSSGQLAASASAESVHAAAEIAAIMQCPPAVDPTLENEPTPQALECTQPPNGPPPYANENGHGGKYHNQNHQHPPHAQVPPVLAAHQAGSHDNLMVLQQQHSGSAVSLHGQGSIGAGSPGGFQPASNLGSQQAFFQQQQQGYGVVGQHHVASPDKASYGHDGLADNNSSQIGSQVQPSQAHSLSPLGPGRTSANDGKDSDIPWDRLDRKLVHGWVHHGQCVALEEQSTSTPDSIYAELREATQVSRHLWLGNLSPDLERSSLLNVAQAFGQLTDLSTFPGAEYAFLSFESVQPACRACELLDGQQVPVLTGQRAMIVKFRPDALNVRLLRPPSASSNGPTGSESGSMMPSPRLWLGNISNQVTAAAVRAAFDGFGTVIDAAAFPARIGPLGYAIVVFDKVEDAARAVASKNNRPDPLLSGSRPLKMRYKPDKELGLRGSPNSSGNLSPSRANGSIGSPNSQHQDKTSHHLMLSNLMRDVAPSAIQLAFGQYGALERPPILEFSFSTGTNEARLAFREVSSAVAAQRALNGAFIPSLTGSKPLAIRFMSEGVSSSGPPLSFPHLQPQPHYQQQQQAGGPLQQQQHMAGRHQMPHPPSGRGPLHSGDLFNMPHQQQQQQQQARGPLQQQQGPRPGSTERQSPGTFGQQRPIMGLGGNNWAGGIPRPNIQPSTDSDDDGTMPAVNLSNRLNPNNIHFDRLLAAQYKRMSKPEKEALWAQDRLMQQQQQQNQGGGGDTAMPLRSSLAGLRLGESRGIGAFGLPSRAFSHADLHVLSGSISDVNPFTSHTDLAALAAGLPQQPTASSLMPAQQQGLQRGAYNSQFASHPNLSSALLQRQATQLALQQQQSQIAQQQVKQLQQLAAAQVASQLQPQSMSAVQQHGGGGSEGPLDFMNARSGMLPAGKGGNGQNGPLFSAMNRSASSPHMDAPFLHRHQQPPVGTRLAAAQHPSHGSLASFALPHPRLHGSAVPAGSGAAGPSPLSRGVSHPNLPSVAAAAAASGGGSRFVPSLQQFGDGCGMTESSDGFMTPPLHGVQAGSEAYGVHAVGGSGYANVAAGGIRSASFNALQSMQQQQGHLQQLRQQQLQSIGDGNIASAGFGTPQQPLQQQARGQQQGSGGSDQEGMQATVAEAVHNAFQEMARQQASQGPLHLHHNSQDQLQQQQQQVGGQQSMQASSSVGMPSHLLDPITQGLMLDPVVAADGVTYDRSAISQWLLTSNTSPATGEPLQHGSLTPNTSVRSYVTAYLTAAAASGR